MVKSTEVEKIEYTQLSELKEVANKIISFAGNQVIWLFEGEMGAGKTTLIRAICDCYGVEDNVTSPTFSLVNEYLTSTGNTIYHFDFYRLKHETEALDIGVEDYLSSGNLCFLEWPSKIQSLLPPSHFVVHITPYPEKRVIELFKNSKSEL